jgi:hypothetical protein
MSYQWQLNGTNISGATNADLTLPGVSVADSGQYRAIASNRLGSVTSSAAIITVQPVDRAPVRLGNLLISSGGSVTFGIFSPAGAAFDLSSLSGLGFEVSSDLAHWAPITNFQLLSNGVVSLTDPASSNIPSRFYRLNSQ